MGKKYIREALNGDPDNPKFQKANRNFIKAEKLKKEATDLFTAGNYPESIEIFTECIKLDPLNRQYNSAILFNRAVAYSKMALTTNDYQKTALDDLTEAIKINPSYVKAYIKRGEMYMGMSDYEEAIRDFSQAKQLDPCKSFQFDLIHLQHNTL